MPRGDAMRHFRSFDDTDIAYLDEGAGPAVLLLHGFAADHRANWVAPGVVDALVGSGRRVVAADARGHGASAKPTDPARYAGTAMVDDARALLDHLSITAVDVVGYSMGSMVAARLVPREPRARALVLGGIGDRALQGPPPANGARIAALLTDDPSSITDPVGRDFRRFADRMGADRHALAAIQRAPNRRQPGRFPDITVPTLVLIGDRDVLLGSPQQLADRIPGAIVRIVPGNHITAVSTPAFRGAIVEFLDRPQAA
jgi:pimeloyl-ACP methyl ester carboxylesterase